MDPPVNPQPPATANPPYQGVRPTGPSPTGLAPPGPPGPAGGPPQARRGRPPGSGSFTEEKARTIITYIRGGVFAEVAAQAAGVAPRTFREWMARGEDTHPTRPPNPKLRRFAADVRQAQAQARAGAEARVHQQQPALWLKWAARTTPEQDGWTELGQPDKAEAPGSSLMERLAAIRAREEEEAASAAREATSDCPDPQCSCTYHHRRYDDERQRIIDSHYD